MEFGGTDAPPETISSSAGQAFSVEVWIDNHTNKIKIPQGNIFELVIEEDIFNWPFRGYLTYSNANEFMERSGLWFYRMDCRDEITIKLKVVHDTSYEKSQFPEDVWEMDIKCVIYNSEDMPADQMIEKSKKIYFWDKNYQLMRETIAQWSTATASNTKSPSHSSDYERSMLTGDAIQYLLEKVAGFEDIAEIDKTKYWDKGVSRVLYTSLAQNSIMDDLEYLLSNHVSAGGDFCLFGYTDRSKKKKLKLMSMGDIYELSGKEKPGDLSNDVFYFEPIDGEGEGMTTPFRSPVDDNISFKINIQIAEWNKISSYKFVDMAGIDSAAALISRPVYSYNLKDKGFAVDVVDHEISNVKEAVKELYIKNLYPSGKSDPLFTLNQTKTEQKAIDPQFTYTYSSEFGDNKLGRLANGKLKTLMGSVFTNENIEFTVNGSPHRTVGRFIGIERHASESRNRFDDKLLGQWFVTNVKHIWSFNRYMNVINAVKINSFNKYLTKEDVI